ncbi:malate synthase A [Egibacter rhizosphaerae]|uniref:Malate synthase n=1 Tax=Egibacter rhizosphaerae TaxID=1670831 RepID=A0A411YJM6_9ACTN|nr:malate synthase A [Egibacter rhizosphaerae]QBI21372.1 malate synthase A [Egibacter rhizosphaerae]
MSADVDGVEVHGSLEGRRRQILTDEALAFLGDLQRDFKITRDALLAERAERRERLAYGELPDFLPETAHVREGDWQVAPPPADLADRRTEITGPTDRKMVINALNSGARVFMADFEDSNSPTWANMVDGQANLADAIRRRIDFVQDDGKEYRLVDEPATLVVRPRGWHLDEPCVVVDGERMVGGLFDFGLYLFHNHRELAERGSGPYFYLPKLENHREARLWNGVFRFAQERLAIPQGTIKATVLIEHILAAFEMEEILHELRDHSAGLNAGRWDYIFSVIKSFPNRREFVLPDRAQVTMTVPFMRAYTELLVATCHRRGAHAIGGMAAFIPSRKDAEVNERAIANVRADKQREATDGCDGTWVAHPDLVPVAMEEFDAVLGRRPNQVDRQRDDVAVGAKELLDIRVPEGQRTEAGLRANVRVGLLYIESWLRGQGAAALFNLMEDAATAEISRSQIWQWQHHGVRLEAGDALEGEQVAPDLVHRVIDEELAAIRDAVGAEQFTAGHFEEARTLFEQVALGDDLDEFLTVPGMPLLD